MTKDLRHPRNNIQRIDDTYVSSSLLLLLVVVAAAVSPRPFLVVAVVSLSVFFLFVWINCSIKILSYCIIQLVITLTECTRNDINNMNSNFDTTLLLFRNHQPNPNLNPKLLLLVLICNGRIKCMHHSL